MSKMIDWSQAHYVLAATPWVIAAWAFGSAQDGHVSPGSDVDVGLLTESLPSYDNQLDLLGRLQGALQSEEIDLVVLNGANPILRFEAISGRPIYCRDPGQRAEFASLTAREYEDEMALWQRALRDRP